MTFIIPGGKDAKMLEPPGGWQIGHSTDILLPGGVALQAVVVGSIESPMILYRFRINGSVAMETMRSITDPKAQSNITVNVEAAEQPKVPLIYLNTSTSKSDVEDILAECVAYGWGLQCTGLPSGHYDDFVVGGVYEVGAQDGSYFVFDKNGEKYHDHTLHDYLEDGDYTFIVVDGAQAAVDPVPTISYYLNNPATEEGLEAAFKKAHAEVMVLECKHASTDWWTEGKQYEVSLSATEDGLVICDDDDDPWESSSLVSEINSGLVSFMLV